MEDLHLSKTTREFLEQDDPQFDEEVKDALNVIERIKAEWEKFRAALGLKVWL